MSTRPARTAGIRAPADKRFRRAQVRQPARRGWRALISLATLRLIAVIAVVTVGAFKLVGVALESDHLRVQHLQVRGVARIAAGEIEALVDGLRGDHVLTADLESYRRRLLQSPWVADATLRRVLPSTVEIAVIERRPMSIGRLDGRLFLVDASGMVIEEHGPQHAEYDLPIVDGLSGNPRETGFMVDPMRARLAARVIEATSLDPAIGPRVSQIDVSDPHDAVVLLDGDRALLHVGEDEFVKRLRSYLTLAPTLHERLDDIDYVDLRFDERIYVRPRSARPGAVRHAAARY